MPKKSIDFIENQTEIIENESIVPQNECFADNVEEEENVDKEEIIGNEDKTTIVIKQQKIETQSKPNKSKIKIIETQHSIQTRNKLKRELPDHLELKIIRPDYMNIEAPPKRGRPKKYEVRQPLSSQMKNPPRRYPCPFAGCEYVAKYRSNLWDHKKLHTGEKPYACQWPSCDMRFPQSQVCFL